MPESQKPGDGPIEFASPGEAVREMAKIVKAIGRAPKKTGETEKPLEETSNPAQENAKAAMLARKRFQIPSFPKR